MNALFFVVIGFILIIIAFLLWSPFRAYRKYKNIPEFQEYQVRHPKLVDNGEVTCCKCGGRQVAVRPAGNIGRRLINVHICSTCGETLYRSES